MFLSHRELVKADPADIIAFLQRIGRCGLAGYRPTTAHSRRGNSTTTTTIRLTTDHVKGLQQLVLFTAVQSVNNNDQPSVIVSERVHASCQVANGFNLLLQQLHQPINLQGVDLPRYTLNLSATTANNAVQHLSF